MYMVVLYVLYWRVQVCECDVKYGQRGGLQIILENCTLYTTNDTHIYVFSICAIGINVDRLSTLLYIQFYITSICPKACMCIRKIELSIHRQWTMQKYVETDATGRFVYINMIHSPFSLCLSLPDCTAVGMRANVELKENQKWKTKPFRGSDCKK